MRSATPAPVEGLSEGLLVQTPVLEKMDHGLEVGPPVEPIILESEVDGPLSERTLHQRDLPYGGVRDL